MEYHIDSLANKINKILGIMHKLKYKLNNNNLFDLYNSLIYPHLMYCNLLWGNSPYTHLKALEKCQNHFIRIVINLPSHSHTKTYYEKLNILSIKNIHIYNVSIFIFKFLQKKLPSYYTNFFIFSNAIQTKSTRHTQLFYKPISRIKLLDTSIKCVGPRIWETIIPQEIKQITQLHLFKNNLKKFLLSLNSIT